MWVSFQARHHPWVVSDEGVNEMVTAYDQLRLAMRDVYSWHLFHLETIDDLLRQTSHYPETMLVIDRVRMDLADVLDVTYDGPEVKQMLSGVWLSVKTEVEKIYG